MNRKVNLSKLVKVGDKWTYRKPAYTKKTGILTTRVIHNGKEAELGGSFVLRWYENGQRRRRNLETGDAVVAMTEFRKLSRLLEARADGVPVVESSLPEKRSLQKAVDEFLEEARVNKAKKTWQAFKQVLGTFLEVCPHSNVEDITRRDVMVKFVGRLQAQGLADRTQFHRFACLISFLKRNKCDVVTLKDAPRYTEEEITIYTDDELNKFFETCTFEEALLGRFLLSTGVREQEAQYAEWSDVSFADNLFRVRAKPRLGFRPKDCEERILPMPPELVADLKKAKTQSRSNFLFAKNGHTDGHLIRRVKEVGHRAGLNCGECEGVGVGRKQNCKQHAVCSRWKLHRFRHTFGTLLARETGDPRTVQKRMGHSSLETTMRYFDYIRSHDKQAHEAVSQTFSKFWKP
jgi:integrase/recombinase XerD